MIAFSLLNKKFDKKLYSILDPCVGNGQFTFSLEKSWVIKLKPLI